MKTYENTFIRGVSPSYSDDSRSDNIMSAALDTRTLDKMETIPSYFDDKFNCVYGDSIDSLKQGRNTFVFWTIITILLLLTVGNLILTLTIIGVLHLGRGIHGMELVPEEGITKFYGSTDLDRVYSKNFGQIEGFTDIPVSITGEDGSVNVRLWRNGKLHPRIIIDELGTQFLVNNFEIKDPIKGETIFTTHHPHFNAPKGVNTLITKLVSASRIASPIDHPLHVESESILIKGSEGITLDASSTLLRASNNIAINSTNGPTTLEGNIGIFLDINKIPIVSSEFGLRTGSVQYKICVCMPQGALFRIAIPRIHNGPKISCAHFSSKHDPCAMT